MPLYMKIEEGVAIGFPVDRPAFIPYTDPNTGVTGYPSAEKLSDADLYDLAGYAQVDPAFALGPINEYATGGSFNAGTLLATPNVSTIALQTLKSDAKTAALAFAEYIRGETVGNIGAYEVVGWAVKAERALRFQTSSETAEDTAIMQSEADLRGLGETAAVLAAIQMAKANGLSAALALVDGMTDGVITVIDAASDPADPAILLAAYQTTLQTNLAALLSGS
jgi:GNAT superfamily N-acetyltransferase